MMNVLITYCESTFILWMLDDKYELKNSDHCYYVNHQFCFLYSSWKAPLYNPLFQYGLWCTGNIQFLSFSWVFEWEPIVQSWMLNTNCVNIEQENDRQGLAKPFLCGLCQCSFWKCCCVFVIFPCECRWLFCSVLQQMDPHGCVCPFHFTKLPGQEGERKSLLSPSPSEPAVTDILCRDKPKAKLNFYERLKR